MNLCRNTPYANRRTHLPQGREDMCKSKLQKVLTMRLPVLMGGTLGSLKLVCGLDLVFLLYLRHSPPVPAPPLPLWTSFCLPCVVWPWQASQRAWFSSTCPRLHPKRSPAPNHCPLQMGRLPVPHNCSLYLKLGLSPQKGPNCGLPIRNTASPWAVMLFPAMPST